MKEVKGYPLPLGVTIEKQRINFSIAVKSLGLCQLLIYKVGETQPIYIFDMPQEESIGEVRYLSIEDKEGTFAEHYEYNYLIDQKVVLDPRAYAIAGKEVWGMKVDISQHEIRGKISKKKYDWSGDKSLNIPYHNIIAYSLHVRGFTKSISSGVKNKGTFLGIIEKIPYLKELGINQLQCMPIYEFEECMKHTNYWGYGDAFFFAPKASYAAGDNVINELKEMVKSCHLAQIEVVLELPFTSDVSIQTAIDCLRYFVLEYHIDGFVLNPNNVSISDICSDPILKSTKIMQSQTNFQNTMRRFLKGDEGMISDVIWNLRHGSKEDGVYHFMASHDGFTLQDMVSYDKKHNEANGENNQDGLDYNYSWNCGVEGETRKKQVLKLRTKQLKNAFSLLLTAQGVPCLLAGDEFGNTQKGNNNAYCQDNEIGWINWKKGKKELELLTFIKALIAFRTSHPVLHRDTPLLGMDQMAYGIPDISYHGENAWQTPSEVTSRKLGIMYCGECAKDVDCFTAYNMHWTNHIFALPTLSKKKKWYRVIDTSVDLLLEPELLCNQKEIMLEERTVVILIGR